MTEKEILSLNPYLDLFLTFAQIGVCTFGGGYAMLPILQREVVEKRGWATEDELMDYYAIGQCTPGVIAVNTSTFIGYRLRGVPGAITATAGMVFPSLVIITIIAAFIQQFAHLAVVQHAFAGIRIAVCALVLQSEGALYDACTVAQQQEQNAAVVAHAVDPAVNSNGLACVLQTKLAAHMRALHACNRCVIHVYQSLLLRFRLSRNYSFADKQERTVGRSKVVRKFLYRNFLPPEVQKW